MSEKGDTSTGTIAMVQQPESLPVQNLQVDVADFLLLATTLLGGGSAGFRFWKSSRNRLHAEQLLEARRILEDNQDQHRKLNIVRDQLSEVLDKLEELERHLPKKKKKDSKKSEN